ncbi:hypothetical protein MPSEU_000146300 [Mayamaea pseudoterrestris]|nr:hypothetical protein MPSEU_000146300 [Mayamaea pseudoterrestris]
MSSPTNDEELEAIAVAVASTADIEFNDSSDASSSTEKKTPLIRLTRMKGNNTRGCFGKSNNSNKRKKPTLNHLMVFNKRLEEARYEVDVDPYRGICAKTQAEMDASPWLKSCGNPDNEPVGINEENAEALETVRFTSISTCPTLLRWTIEAQKKAAMKNKRKRKGPKPEETVIVGVRPDDSSFVCECDSNPFCLVTLGGVMNDILLEKAKTLQQAKFCTPDNDDDNDSDVMETDECRPAVTFRSNTQALLDSTRKSVWIDANQVKLYLKPLLDGIMPLSDAVEMIRSSQRALVFDNPVNIPSRVRQRDGSIRFAVPPGISNLGATCYLNTQLQCLAQNLVFTKGIFRWQSPNCDDRMNNVISLFQELLARMREGAQNTCSALEWTTALGLDHGEQQDPNEFSRLLFARMSESFQAQALSNAPRVEDGESNLATLLSDLFQGAILYETKCLKCGTISSRREEFEDINLPIEKRPKEKRKSISSFFTRNKEFDTDLQYCLERYCEEEHMDGDNQYFCSVCNEKQNATRRTLFERLPPCLNIQLCRYVYDRNKGEKKKLSDKVRLPTEIRVEAIHNGTTQQHRYLLCAVMRHKGTTAYSGHYVAEAMDWPSGQWFEFNDETVTRLELGPNCSYNPNAPKDNSTDDEQKESAKKQNGSNEAYNMYYVEENFLAQSIYDHFRETSPSLLATTVSPSVLGGVRLDRSEHYSKLTKMCTDDKHMCEQLENRRSALRILFQEYHTVSSCDEQSVLVDSQKLCEYIACKPVQSDADFFDSGCGLLLRTDECAHQLLHPRDACRGKLIPASLFDRLVILIDNELNTLGDNERCINTLAARNLACQECAEVYVIELASKLESLEQQGDLLSAFDCIDLGLSDDADSLHSATKKRFLYAVSNTFLRQFRAHMQRLRKAVGDSKLNTIDALDPSTIAFELKQTSDNSSPVDKSEHSEFQRDSLVNGSVICRHGNLNTNKTTSVDFVSFETWSKIVTLFPAAECLKIDQDYVQIPSGIASLEAVCADCRDQSDAERQAKQRLKEIMKFLKKGIEEALVIYTSDPDQITRLDADETYVIMFKSDLTNWKRFAVTVQRCEPKADESLEQFAKRLLSPQSASWTPQSLLECHQPDKERVELVFSLFRPILCEQHGSPLYDALFKENLLNGDLQLRSDLVLFTEQDYQVFLSYVVAMTYALMANDCLEDRDANLDMHDAGEFIKRMKLSHSIHPVLRPRSELQSDVSASRSAVSLAEDISAKACCDDDCASAFRNWIFLDDAATAHKLSETKVSIMQDGMGTAKDDPIILDSDGEHKKGTSRSFTLRVFEAASRSGKGDIVSAVEQCMAWSSETPDNELLRRSTRKRKTRYPIGVITDEDTVQTSLGNNVAALRLCLMERCSNGSIYELNHTVALIFRHPPTTSPVAVDTEDCGDLSTSTTLSGRTELLFLPFDQNVMTLLELCESKLEADVVNNPAFDPSDYIALLRVSDVDESFSDIDKEALMDLLIDTSNAATKSNSATKSKSRNRAAERGFSGTLLSSALSGNTSSEKAESQEVATEIETEHAKDVANSCRKRPQETIDVDGGLELYIPNKRPQQAVEEQEKREMDVVRCSSVLDDIFSSPRNSDDESMTGLESPVLPTMTNTLIGNSAHNVEPTTGSALGQALLDLLRQNPDVTDERVALTSAMWTVREGNPQGEVEATNLLDTAYSKYLESTIQ